MKVLVLNSGSSSLKYQLIDMDSEDVLEKGNYERIGGDSMLTHKVNGGTYQFNHPVLNHEEALKVVLELLTDSELGAIYSIEEIDAVGHRVVSGGDVLNHSMLVTEDVLEKLGECIGFAPIHNPAAIAGINACIDLIPTVPNVITFDTSFHSTLKSPQYIFPIPYEYYEKYHLRRYGAHGMSHSYVSSRLAELKGVPLESLKVISCHLGQGASICAIKDGKSIDTSMGYTPVAGIPMGSRSGDLDPSVVTFLMDKEHLSPSEMEDILNKESGVYGISKKVSKDFRDVESKVFKDNPNHEIRENPYKEDKDYNCDLAIEIFLYNIAKTIASYTVPLEGCDCIIFTAGIGERGIEDRQLICKKLEYMGVKLDLEKNNSKNIEGKISTPDSKIEVWVIPTNEELAIARDTKRIVEQSIGR